MPDKKKKSRINVTYTTGCIPYNLAQFNKRAGIVDNNNPTPIEPFEDMGCKMAAAASYDTLATDSHLGLSAGEGASIGGGEGGEGMGESLINEDTIYVPKMERQIDIPDTVKVLPQAEVNRILTALSPEEIFKVGYITPIYFYKELVDKLNVIKLTEFEGYTGLDYRDATPTLGNTAAIANAKAQALNPKGGTIYSQAGSDLFNTENNRVKSGKDSLRKEYGQINKTVKQNDRYDKTNPGNFTLIKNLETVLFYPAPGSKPKVKYFVKLASNSTYMEIPRKYLVDKIYNLVLEATNNQQLGLKARLKAEKAIETDNKTTPDIALSTGNDIDAYDNAMIRPSVRALYTNQIYYISTDKETLGGSLMESLATEALTEETKRYIKRYYIRPQNIVCSNKEEILKALVEIGDENCSVYSLKNLDDHDDVHLLTTKDIIYYYDNGILYDKNHVKVMDYELGPKHEEERKRVNDIDDLTNKEFSNMYDDRLTDADLTNDETIKVKEGIETPTKPFKNPIVIDLTDNGNVGQIRIEAEDEALAREVDTLATEAWENGLDDLDAEDLAGYEYFDKIAAEKGLNFEPVFDNDMDDEYIDQIKDKALTESDDLDDDDNKQYCVYINGEPAQLYNSYEDAYYAIEEQGIENAKIVAVSAGEADYVENDISNSNYVSDDNEEDEEETTEEDYPENPFDLKFEAYNANGKRIVEGKEVEEFCCICGEPLNGYGNNPVPYKEEGRCCDACNIKFVIPARLAQLANKEAKEE